MTSLTSGTIVTLDGESYMVQDSGSPWSLEMPDASTLRFEVQQGDRWYADPPTKNRSEIAMQGVIADDTPINVSYGMEIEPGANNTAAFCILGQFHQAQGTAVSGLGPPFSIDLVGEKMTVVVGYTNASGQNVSKTIFVDTGNIVRGHYYAIDVQVAFDPNGSGHLIVIRDGLTLVNYTGPLGYHGEGGVYWKEGIYRAAAPETLVVDYTNLSVTAYTPINDPFAGTDANQGTFGLGINDSGEMVGRYKDSSFGNHGYFYSNGVFNSLNDPLAGSGRGQGTTAIGINDNGEIVGGYRDPNNVEHGFLFRAGQFTTLDDPHAGSGQSQGTYGYDINHSDEITGYFVNGSGVNHGFSYTNGVFTTLNDPLAAIGPSLGTKAYGVNDKGQIVGVYFDASGNDHGFFLGLHGKYTTIDDPLAGVAEGQGTFALGINDNGEIVGGYFDAGGVEHGFLYSLTTGKYFTIDNPLGAEGTEVDGINDKGQVVGFSIDSNGVHHGFHAYIG